MICLRGVRADKLWNMKYLSDLGALGQLLHLGYRRRLVEFCFHRDDIPSNFKRFPLGFFCVNIIPFIPFSDELRDFSEVLVHDLRMIDDVQAVQLSHVLFIPAQKVHKKRDMKRTNGRTSKGRDRH